MKPLWMIERWPWNRAKTPEQLWRGRCRICTRRVYWWDRERLPDLPNGKLIHRKCHPIGY